MSPRSYCGRCFILSLPHTHTIVLCFDAFPSYLRSHALCPKPALYTNVLYTQVYRRKRHHQALAPVRRWVLRHPSAEDAQRHAQGAPAHRDGGATPRRGAAEPRGGQRARGGGSEQVHERKARRSPRIRPVRALLGHGPNETPEARRRSRRRSREVCLRAPRCSALRRCSAKLQPTTTPAHSTNNNNDDIIIIQHPSPPH